MKCFFGIKDATGMNRRNMFRLFSSCDNSGC